MVDPKLRAAHPLTDLELERYKQLQVSGYHDIGAEVLADTACARSRSASSTATRWSSARCVTPSTGTTTPPPRRGGWRPGCRTCRRNSGVDPPGGFAPLSALRRQSPPRGPSAASATTPVTQSDLLAFASAHPYLSLALAALTLALVFTEVAGLFRGFKALGPAQLTALINRDNALVVDLRPQADFEKGHIPGSKNVQMSQFDPGEQATRRGARAAGGAGLQDRPDRRNGALDGCTRRASSACTCSTAASARGNRPTCRWSKVR